MFKLIINYTYHSRDVVVRIRRTKFELTFYISVFHFLFFFYYSPLPFFFYLHRSTSLLHSLSLPTFFEFSFLFFFWGSPVFMSCTVYTMFGQRNFTYIKSVPNINFINCWDSTSLTDQSTRKTYEGSYWDGRLVLKNRIRCEIESMYRVTHLSVSLSLRVKESLN